MKKYILHSAYIALMAVLIFGFQYLPFQDFPILFYQGFVFNEVVFHGNTFEGFFHFHSYMPPNAISTILLGCMDLIAPVFISGKMYLFLLAIVLYSGMYRYLSFHLNQKKAAFAILAFFLTMNIHFLMSYLNFLTGLAIVLHTIVFIREKKYENSFIPMSLAFIIIYVCHFAAFALFSLYFFLYFISNKNYRGISRMFLSAIPSLVIFIHYLFTRTLPILPLKESYDRFIDLIHWKFLILFSPLIPFNVFKWVQDIPFSLRIGDYFFAAVVLFLILYIVGKSIVKHKFSLELSLGITTFLLAIFLPLNFGGVIPAGERVVVFCVLNLFIVLFREKISQPYRKAALILCFSLGIASYSYNLWNTAIFNSMVEKNDIPLDAITHPNLKLEGTNGFLHLHFYDDVIQKKPYPCFEIGLFEYPDSLLKN